ncbi:PEP-CTERM sorting domain-containing protein [Gloeothece verrucosa]|uniref:PEP-CTERM sorting domain-containing protein n=1 Tax=Gloeothece verrucosa TaxID=2546359 RepID=UPI0003237709|nr:PEP-CTERM sorting domain-containing protein [Gloeothece verrucosa]
MNFNLSSTIALFGAVGVAATSIVGTTTSAQAATVVGSISLGGAPVTAVSTGLKDPSGNYITTLNFANFGGTNPAGTGQFVVTDADGIFSSYDPAPIPFAIGTIKDLPPFPTPVTAITNFLKLNLPKSTTFDLNGINSVTYTPSGNGVNVSFGVTGIFKQGSSQYQGVGTFGAEITFPVRVTNPVGNIRNLAQFNQFLASSNRSITVRSWSANLTASVPEPLTLLGVSTALGFGGFFKRKLANKQEK